jgi:hypothetical protein
MGYSISIQVPSDDLRRKMLGFMKAKYRRWSVVCGITHNEWNGSAGDPTDDYSYGKTENSIGFDYQSGMHGFERDYIYSVLRWMAIKVGDRQLTLKTDEDEPELTTFQEPVPYYKYDCDEQFTPILVVTEDQEAELPEDHRYWAVDSLGVRIGPTSLDIQISSCSGVFGEHSANILTESKMLGEAPKKEGPERESWMELHREIYLKYLRPEIDDNITRIRQEILRLDKLWDA